MNRPDINVTPLIDVLLVLLIIFMIITPMKPSRVEAKVPREPVKDNAGVHPHTLVVSVDIAGRMRLNKEEFESSIVEPGPMINRLSEVFREREQNRIYAHGTETTANPRIEKTVFLKAPHGLDYGSVAKVVDAVKASGAYPVAFQIDDIE